MSFSNERQSILGEHMWWLLPKWQQRKGNQVNIAENSRKESFCQFGSLPEIMAWKKRFESLKKEN